MFNVYKIVTYDGEIFYITDKQNSIIKSTINKNPSACFNIGENIIRLSSIKKIERVKMDAKDLPGYCLEKVKKEGTKMLTEGEDEFSGFSSGTVFEYYDEFGNSIKKPLITEKNLPRKYLGVKKAEYFEYKPGENGGTELVKVGEKVVEKDYYRVVLGDGYYDFLLAYALDGEGKVLIDRRPDNWSFGSEL